mmetsp:Transcript_155834/g.499607  ORF Transcript_155834/g.499607 Transcript_155834/m.499607 type:complete len:295 (+) Transcript_155834:245-1129(+)
MDCAMPAAMSKYKPTAATTMNFEASRIASGESPQQNSRRNLRPTSLTSTSPSPSSSSMSFTNSQALKPMKSMNVNATPAMAKAPTRSCVRAPFLVERPSSMPAREDETAEVARRASSPCVLGTWRRACTSERLSCSFSPRSSAASAVSCTPSVLSRSSCCFNASLVARAFEASFSNLASDPLKAAISPCKRSLARCIRSPSSPAVLKVFATSSESDVNADVWERCSSSWFETFHSAVRAAVVGTELVPPKGRVPRCAGEACPTTAAAAVGAKRAAAVAVAAEVCSRCKSDKPPM